MRKNLLPKTFLFTLLSLVGYIRPAFAQAPVINPIQGTSVICVSGTAPAAYTVVAMNTPTAYSWSYATLDGPVLTLSPAGSVCAVSFSAASTLATYTLFCYASNAAGNSQTVAIVVNAYANPEVSFSGSQSFCQGSSTHLSASSTIFQASSTTLNYSWTPPTGLNTTSSHSVIASPATNVNYSVLVTNGPCMVTSTVAVNVFHLPLLTVSGANTVCLGASLGFMASGASGYTWSNGATTASVLLQPVQSGTYSVTGTDLNGCSDTSVVAVSVFTPAPVSVSGANTVCLGTSLGFVASGASTYTWSNGVTTASVLLQPVQSGTYSVTGTDLNGCSDTSVVAVSVFTPAPVSVSGATTVCLGSSLGFVASGASTYTWSNGAITASVTLQPVQSGTYSVTGTDHNACSDTAVVAVSVFTPVPLSLSGTNTVCLGSSLSFVASGASTYTWSNGANTPSVLLQPLQSGSYSLAGTDLNGCVSSSVVVVTVNSACSDVWPGDANSDGVVNGLDVIELGFVHLSTGNPRPGASPAYTAQYADNWSGTVSTGKNSCHADCNGDGVVDASDTLAIYLNFSLTHNFRSATSGSQVLRLVPDDSSEVVPGDWYTLQVLLADAVTPVSLYGLTFDIDYLASALEPDSVYLSFTPSFLNQDNDPMIHFRKLVFSGQKLHVATVRTTQTDATGYGRIATLRFKTRPGLSGATQLPFSLSNISLVHADRRLESLDGNTLSLPVSASPVGLSKHTAPASFRLYPSPASGLVTLEHGGAGEVSYTICDLTGRPLLEGHFIHKTLIDVSVLKSGVYFLNYNHGGLKSSGKLIVQH
jgi:hypothetical protein